MPRTKKEPYAYQIEVAARKDYPFYFKTRIIHENGDIVGERDYLEYDWINQVEAESTRRKAWENYKKKHPSNYLTAKIVKIYKPKEN